MLKHEHGMRDVMDLIGVIQRLKTEGATRIEFHPNGEVASIEIGPVALPRSNEDIQDEPSDPRKTYPRRPTGGLVTRQGEDV